LGQRNGIKHILIEPGAPTQNGYIESFNGKFRDECLNEHWFETLPQARVVIQAWVQDYNEVRPHSSIGRMPPRCFARLHRQQAADEGSTSTAALAIPLTPRLPRNDWYGGWGQVRLSVPVEIYSTRG
jgi:putative transposase